MLLCAILGYGPQLVSGLPLVPSQSIITASLSCSVLTYEDNSWNGECACPHVCPICVLACLDMG